MKLAHYSEIFLNIKINKKEDQEYVLLNYINN